MTIDTIALQEEVKKDAETLLFARAKDKLKQLTLTSDFNKQHLAKSVAELAKFLANPEEYLVTSPLIYPEFVGSDYRIKTY